MIKQVHTEFYDDADSDVWPPVPEMTIVISC